MNNGGGCGAFSRAIWSEREGGGSAHGWKGVEEAGAVDGRTENERYIA